MLQVLRWLPSAVLLLPWLLGPLAPDNAARIRDLASPASFRLLDWESQHLIDKANALWGGLTGTPQASPTDVDALRAYFAAGADRAALRPGAEQALQHVIAQAYRERGLSQSQPVSLASLFPPVLVSLTPPPNVLVIAPRNELRVMSSSVLQPMDVAAQEQLEASADSTGVSSLVAPIGGLATYPSMVLEDDSAEQLLSSVAHEWVHQYLIFYPLGAGYWNSQETREINETTADLVGREVGGQLSVSLGLANPPSSVQPGPGRARPAFDFNAFMRETRGHTEELLSAGQVDDAEAYMRARRDELQQHGYNIRKLNQAYFAMYGSYGDGFAASPSNPIPGLLHSLRDHSTSVGEFMQRVRGVTTVEELRQAETVARAADGLASGAPLAG
jgi:hypothetical protein